jgi:hypothetical protein
MSVLLLVSTDPSLWVEVTGDPLVGNSKTEVAMLQIHAETRCLAREHRTLHTDGKHVDRILHIFRKRKIPATLLFCIRIQTARSLLRMQKYSCKEQWFRYCVVTHLSSQVS